MATASAEGYRSDLVDMKAGQISREIFVNEEIYHAGAGAAVHTCLAVRRA